MANIRDMTGSSRGGADPHDISKRACQIDLLLAMREPDWWAEAVTDPAVGDDPLAVKRPIRVPFDPWSCGIYALFGDGG